MFALKNSKFIFQPYHPPTVTNLTVGFCFLELMKDTCDLLSGVHTQHKKQSKYSTPSWYTYYMSEEPFGEVPERGDTRFTSPAEEIAFLRAQIAEKERQLVEGGHTPENEALIHQEIQNYKETPVREVLHESHTLSEDEMHHMIRDLELNPDRDDTAMEELLGVLEEKGIKNALTVAERMQNPHIEDDFHRVLVQYIAKGHSTPTLAEKTPLWNVLNMTLFEVTLPEPTKIKSHSKSLFLLWSNFTLVCFQLTLN